MMLAKNAFRTWVWQRLSALYLGIYILVALFHFTFSPPDSYDAWIHTLRNPAVSSTTAVFFFMIAVHAWIGIRDIIFDYMHHTMVRMSTLGIVTLALFILFFRAMIFLIRL